MPRTNGTTCPDRADRHHERHHRDRPVHRPQFARRWAAESAPRLAWRRATEVRTYRQFRFTRPPGACELLLVRHGESIPSRDDPPFPLVDGQGDPELDPVGHEQAERVADRLEHEDISAIYVSTLQRTAQTAAPLAARLGITPRVEPDLREVGLGDWEGTVPPAHRRGPPDRPGDVPRSSAGT